MKYVITSLIILLPGICLSQVAGLSVGASSEKNLLIDVSYQAKSKFVAALDVNLKFATGAEGEHYSTLSWNEFPQDFVSQGEYSNSYNLGLGYQGQWRLMGLLGLQEVTGYLNSFDEQRILATDGNYHVTRLLGYKLNAGLELGRKLSSDWYLSAHYTLSSGVGFRLGYLMDLH